MSALSIFVFIENFTVDSTLSMRGCPGPYKQVVVIIVSFGLGISISTRLGKSWSRFNVTQAIVPKHTLESYKPCANEMFATNNMINNNKCFFITKWFLRLNNDC